MGKKSKVTRTRIIRSITASIKKVWTNYAWNEALNIDWATHVSNNKRIVVINMELNTQKDGR